MEFVISSYNSACHKTVLICVTGKMRSSFQDSTSVNSQDDVRKKGISIGSENGKIRMCSDQGPDFETCHLSFLAR